MVKNCARLLVPLAVLIAIGYSLAGQERLYRAGPQRCAPAEFRHPHEPRCYSDRLHARGVRHFPPLMMVLINNGVHFGGGGPREAFAVAMVWQVVVLSVLLFRRLRTYYRKGRESARAAAEAQRESAFRRAKNQLYSNLSHEFRTPLTIMRGLAARLSGKEEDRRLLQRHNEDLLDLVNQLLELDRLDDNKLAANYTTGDLAAETAGIVFGFRTLAAEREIKLEFSAHPTQIQADYAKRFWRLTSLGNSSFNNG